MGMGMMEIDSVDVDVLVSAASQFASYPGVPSESVVKEFLSKYPFPVLFSALARQSEGPEFVNTIVEALEKILQSPYGSGMLVEVLPYATLGLTADSPLIRKLACSSIAKLLENGDPSSAETAAAFGIVHPLLSTLCDEDSSVAQAAADSLVHLAKSPVGLELLFTGKGGDLKNLAVNGSALVRIRALSLTARVFGLSDLAAEKVHSSGIFSVLERELGNADDTLAQINAVEILCELAETPTGSQLLLTGNFVRQLILLIGSSEVDALVRSRSMLVGSRLISALSETDGLQIIQGISNCLRRLEELDNSSGSWDRSEKEAAIEALGRIGSSAYGAQVLLRSLNQPAKYVVHAAFMGRGDSLHLTAVHALASISGSEREEVVLDEQSENALRALIFDAVHISSHNTVSNKLLQLLQQTAELRQAVYRLLLPLISRPWCLWEVSSNTTLVDLIVDPRTETSSKEAMEWRHACCVALASRLSATAQRGEPVPAELLEKLNVAVRRGPFLSKDQIEAIPTVATEERF